MWYELHFHKQNQSVEFQKKKCFGLSCWFIIIVEEGSEAKQQENKHYFVLNNIFMYFYRCLSV